MGNKWDLNLCKFAKFASNSFIVTRIRTGLVAPKYRGFHPALDTELPERCEIAASVSGTVGQVDSSVAAAGETASVQATPTAPDSAGVTASLENSSGATPATVTVATYTENPTPAPAFEAGGGFVELTVAKSTR